MKGVRTWIDDASVNPAAKNSTSWFNGAFEKPSGWMLRKRGFCASIENGKQEIPAIIKRVLDPSGGMAIKRR